MQQRLKKATARGSTHAQNLKDLLNTNHNSWEEFSDYISGNISFASLSELIITPMYFFVAMENIVSTVKLKICFAWHVDVRVYTSVRS